MSNAMPALLAFPVLPWKANGPTTSIPQEPEGCRQEGRLAKALDRYRRFGRINGGELMHFRACWATARQYAEDACGPGRPIDSLGVGRIAKHLLAQGGRAGETLLALEPEDLVELGTIAEETEGPVDPVMGMMLVIDAVRTEFRPAR